MGSSLLKEKKSLGRYLGHTLGLKVIPTSDSHVLSEKEAVQKGYRPANVTGE